MHFHGDSRRKGFARLTALVVLAMAVGAAQAAPAAKKPQYYFSVQEIKSTVAGEDVKTAAREILAKDLAERPQFTSSLDAPATDAEAVTAELKRRKLKGFLVGLSIEAVTREQRPPRPGGKLPQLAVAVKVSVFGTTIPEAKLAFGGDGEAEVIAEVIPRKMDQETASLTNDVLVQAVKQAVDQAVAKLSMPVSKPYNESKRKKGKAP